MALCKLERRNYCGKWLLSIKYQNLYSFQSFILPRLIKRVPGISSNLKAKSKVPPGSGSSLEAVEPTIHGNGS